MSQSGPNRSPPVDAELPLPADATTTPLNDALDVDLPAAVASAFQTSLAADRSPRSLDDWITLLDSFDDDWPPAVADLCHSDDGLHRADTPDQSFRFACVLDAMLLPFLHDAETTVTSRVPGTADDVVFHVTERAVTGSPDAVISFGAASRPPKGEVTPAHAYGTICPFIHTFPDTDSYEDWAVGVDGATTALSLPDALGLAKAMANV